MPTIYNVHDLPAPSSNITLDDAINYIHTKWGGESNFNFYQNAIRHSSTTALPQFFIMLDDAPPSNQTIIGCSALLTNDLISRQDLYPWMACLFIEESHRGRALGNLLSERAVTAAHAAGYPNIYLYTDHVGLYEKYGWTHHTDAYNPFEATPYRVYTKSTVPPSTT
ncbi:hypothetical protein KS4_27150 [Poriferisphaera corsica]|uniref:N-acetyltransferase domain-containing protein n=1 Tax=Poriferisphaera corsica TaxID=2528020 RepID=A0A517YWP3_9BACT|nr:GNAT family N-acetyltransferase [Poriferisphaera corsica]QDU34644.1 hypothetical protein KS4_27150 [Poriferisphaera corsica]